jgi:hypothetical protein
VLMRWIGASSIMHDITMFSLTIFLNGRQNIKYRIQNHGNPAIWADAEVGCLKP